MISKAKTVYEAVAEIKRAIEGKQKIENMNKDVIDLYDRAFGLTFKGDEYALKMLTPVSGDLMTFLVDCGVLIKVA